MPANLELSRYGSAADVPAAEWDALTDGATTYLSHAWLRVREAELPAGAVVRHVLVRADGGPVAKASLQLFRSPPHPLYSPAALLGAGVGRPDEPVAFAAGWSEFRGELPGPAGGTPHRRVALERVVAEAMELAATGGARLLCFGFVPLDVAAELRTVLPADRTAVLYQDAECVLDTSWKTFEDYLEWLPRNRRTRARAEARRFEAAGLRLRELPLSAALDAIVPLNTALMRKYGHDVDETRIRAVYTNQARHLDPVSSVLLAEDPDGGCRGFSLRYRLGDALYSRVVGFDYTRPSVGQYFTLMVYDPVRAGVGLGVDRINLGVGTYEAKLGRGAHPRPLYHVLVGVDDAPGWDPRALERDARERIRAFVDRYGRLVVGPFDPDSWFLAG